MRVQEKGGGGEGLCVENKTGITLHLILCPIVLLNRQAVAHSLDTE